MTDDKLAGALFHQDSGYSLALLQALDVFRQTDVLCDVVLKAGEETIKAHRVVLAASSVYFKAMFAGNMAEKTQGTIVIHEVDAEALKDVINYAYTSEIKVTERNVEEIMSCASMFQMASILNTCSSFLSSRLHPSNCLGIKQLGALYSCHDLEAAATLYAQEHFKEVTTLEEFQLLSHKDLAQLLSSDHLDVVSEECVFIAIMHWVKYDCANRRGSLCDLLQHVRFRLLSSSFIQSQAQLEPMLLTDVAVKCSSCSADGDSWNWVNCDTSSRFSKTRQVLFALGGENTGFVLRSARCLVRKSGCWQDTLPSVDQDILPSVDQDIHHGWKEAIACMPVARTSFAAAANGKNIYVAGGTTSVQALDSVDMYSSAKNTWNSLPPMSQRRNGCAATILNGALYVVGGYDGMEYLNSLEVYRLCGDTWETSAPMRYGRGFCGIGVISGMLYVMGGTTDNGNDPDIYHSSMERYDPGLNTWTIMASMNVPRAYFSAVVLDGALYAIGGFSGRRWLNTVERYDPGTNKWQYVRALSLPRSSFAATVLEGSIYVAGGFTGKHNVNTVESYDPSLDNWSMVCTMPMRRYGLQLVAVEVPCRKYDG